MAPSEESKSGDQEVIASVESVALTLPASTSETENTLERTQDSPNKVESSLGNVLGFVIWMTVIAAFVAVQFFNNDATVMLDVSRDKGLIASGTVVYDGKPSSGTVHIVVTHAKNKRYLSGVVVPAANDGTFTTAGKPLFVGDPNLKEPLLITADYRGAEEKTSKKGTGTAYLDFAPPLSARMIAGISSASILLIALLTALFTGDLTRRKARLLFAVTYLVTFLSLAVPIVVTVMVSQSTYLVEMMREAPIGLVKGTAKGVTEPQWLFNVGGAVETVTEPAVTTTQTRLVAPTDQAGFTGVPQTDAAIVVTQRRPAVETTANSPLDTSSPPAPVAAEHAEPDKSTAPAKRLDTIKVVGGLAVPFYVVMLAALGAGINMTRKVPPVQIAYESSLPADSESFLSAAMKAPLAWLFRPSESIPPDQRKAAAQIRSALIENYMYLLSAPFLAIAVYYLLQAIGSSPAEPVLVLMAFATGLLADQIIDKIRSFAASTLGKSTETKRKESTLVVHQETVETKPTRTETDHKGNAKPSQV